MAEANSPPGALVTIQLLEVTLVSEQIKEQVAKATAPYLRAIVFRSELGRSSPFGSGASSIDLTKEPEPWIATARVALGESILLRIEVWDASIGNHPLVSALDAVVPPWTPTKPNDPPQVLRTNEIEVTYRVVQTRLVPVANQVAPVPRAAGGTTTQATLRIDNKIVVTINDVEGLYQPAPAGSRPPGVPGAARRAGYASLDHGGRIFLNRTRDGKWKRNEQSIALLVKLAVVEGLLPPDAEVIWTISDPDDPTDDDPDMHSEWGAYIDPKDYDEGRSLGAGGQDNGYDSHGALAVDRTPRWEQSARICFQSTHRKRLVPR
jgi:hypothetical protein